MKPPVTVPRVTIFDALGPPVLAAIAYTLLGYSLASSHPLAAVLCLLVAAPLSIRTTKAPYLAYVMTKAYHHRNRNR